MDAGSPAPMVDSSEVSAIEEAAMQKVSKLLAIHEIEQRDVFIRRHAPFRLMSVVVVATGSLVVRESDHRCPLCGTCVNLTRHMHRERFAEQQQPQQQLLPPQPPTTTTTRTTTTSTTTTSTATTSTAATTGTEYGGYDNNYSNDDYDNNNNNNSSSNSNSNSNKKQQQQQQQQQQPQQQPQQQHQQQQTTTGVANKSASCTSVTCLRGTRTGDSGLSGEGSDDRAGETSCSRSLQLWQRLIHHSPGRGFREDKGEEGECPEPHSTEPDNGHLRDELRGQRWRRRARPSAPQADRG